MRFGRELVRFHPRPEGAGRASDQKASRPERGSSVRRWRILRTNVFQAGDICSFLEQERFVLDGATPL